MNTIDLLSLIGHDTALRRVASTNGGEYAGPCPFCGGRDRFRVWPDDGGRGRWWCRRCQRRGDAIDYLRARDNLTFREACERLGTSLPDRTAAPPARPAVTDVEPPAAQWQAKARAFVTWCQERLWAAVGREALEYLYWRGLTTETIQAAGLGYNPRDWRRPATDWGLTGDPVYLSAGITIPHMADGTLWAVKTRRLEPVTLADGRTLRYMSIRGGYQALYLADGLTGDRQAVVLAEGEFDALLLRQQAGDLVDVASLCGAANGVPLRWLLKLLPYKRILAAYDNDEAGQAGAAKLAALSQRVTAIQPLEGKDVTDFYLAGGDLGAWIAFNLARLGL